MSHAANNMSTEKQNEATPALSCGRLVGLLRRLQCKAVLCGGHADHKRDENGKWWIGLRYTATGTLHGRTLSRYQDRQPNTRTDAPTGRVE